MMKNKRVIIILIVLLLIFSIIFLFSLILGKKKDSVQDNKEYSQLLESSIDYFKNAAYQATISYSVRDEKLPEVTSKVLQYRYSNGIEEYFGGGRSYLYIDYNHKQKYINDTGKLKIEKTDSHSHSELLVALLKSAKINGYDENTFDLDVDSKRVEAFIQNLLEYDKTVIPYNDQATYSVMMVTKNNQISYIAVMDKNHRENNIVVQIDSFHNISNIELPKKENFKEEK